MKATLNLATGFLLSISLSAQVGPYYGNNFSSTSIAGSTQTWNNPQNAGTSNNVYSDFGNLPDVVGAHSNYLVVTDFGFNVPMEATIRGIKVEIERSDPNGKSADYSVRIVREGQLGSVEKSTGAAYPTSDGYITYGGPLDVWGESWSWKNLSNGDFGIAIAAQRNGNGGLTAGRIDDIRITLYYGFGTLPLKLISFTASKQEKSVLLKWQTFAEVDMESFAIERSTDGRTFHQIGEIRAANQASNDYAFTDESPLQGGTYYRLKMIGKSADISISKIVPVHFGNYTVISLNPSPWTKGKPLSIKNTQQEKLTILFYTSDGHAVGKAVTNTNDVPVPALTDVKGLIYFKVTDDKNALKGSGSILVY